MEKFFEYLALVFDIHTSYRRFRVDSFFESCAKDWDPNSICIDVGGKREKKKGKFLVEQYILHPIYVNLDSNVKPDYICDACNMPFQNGFADIIICSEMLEHVDNVDDILNEIYRILKTNGQCFICVPFSMHVHGDPKDYGRYTNYFWKKHLFNCGFYIVKEEKQGGYWTTKLNMNKRFLKCYRRRNKYNPMLIIIYPLCVIQRICCLLLEKILPIDETGYTTGYGFVIKKRERDLYENCVNI